MLGWHGVRSCRVGERTLLGERAILDAGRLAAPAGEDGLYAHGRHLRLHADDHLQEAWGGVGRRGDAWGGMGWRGEGAWGGVGRRGVAWGGVGWYAVLARCARGHAVHAAARTGQEASGRTLAARAEAVAGAVVEPRAGLGSGRAAEASEGGVSSAWRSA